MAALRLEVLKKHSSPMEKLANLTWLIRNWALLLLFGSTVRLHKYIASLKHTS